MKAPPPSVHLVVVERGVHGLLAREVEDGLDADLVDVHVVELRDAHQGVQHALVDHLGARVRVHQNVEQNLVGRGV